MAPGRSSWKTYQSIVNWGYEVARKTFIGSHAPEFATFVTFGRIALRWRVLNGTNWADGFGG